jgi:hypothetical protein
MPKATLEFNLDDEFDREAHLLALNGAKYARTIEEIYEQVLRPIIKYGQLDKFFNSEHGKDFKKTDKAEALLGMFAEYLRDEITAVKNENLDE